jgi:hypothetical protein
MSQMPEPEPIVAEERAAPASTADEPGLLADWRRAILLFVVWRGLLFAFVALGLTMTIPNAPPAGVRWQGFPRSPFWDAWVRWDAGWYSMIVERGYSFQRGGWSDAAFFPLFPYATTAVAAVVGNHWVAGLLVSNLATLGALVVLLRIARPMLGADGAERAAIYLLAFPASFFLSAYYSEGLFLLTTAAAFHDYLKGRYVRCGLWGLLASMTRPTGIALMPAMAAGVLWNSWQGRTRPRAAMLGLLLIPVGLLLFMLILYVKVGDPLAFVAAHGAWGRSSAPPHRAVVAALSAMDWSLPRDLVRTITFLDAASALLFLALPLLLFGRCDPALPIYSLLLILVPLSTGSVKSMMRLESVAFPAFFALARLGANRTADRAIVFASALFLGLFNLLFANWFWVG